MSNALEWGYVPSDSDDQKAMKRKIVDGSKEALRWLRLAANQGDNRAKEFAAVISADPDWEQHAAATTSDDALQSGSALNSDYPENEPGIPQYNPTNAVRFDSTTAQRSGYSGSPYPAEVGQSAMIGAQRPRTEAYGSTSVSKRFLDAHSTAGEANITSRNSGIESPIILNRAGPKSYSDGNGDIYTQVGPKGVINTRTGEFTPTN